MTWLTLLICQLLRSCWQFVLLLQRPLLSVCLIICLSDCQVYRSVCLTALVSVCLSVGLYLFICQLLFSLWQFVLVIAADTAFCPSVFLFDCLIVKYIGLFVSLPYSLFVLLSVCLSVYLQLFICQLLRSCWAVCPCIYWVTASWMSACLTVSLIFRHIGLYVSLPYCLFVCQ